MRVTNRTPRRGFTLVELMIGAAITVLIMTILSICFQTTMGAMGAMRAQGDAADQLRALSAVMKKDFKADRSLAADGSTGVRNRGRRISDYMNPAVTPPASGFYYLESPPSTNEGNDGAFDSFRNAPNATYTLGTRIWMTCVAPGGDDSKLFTATVNIGGVPTVFSSEAAEVAYFLWPMNQTTATAGGTSTTLFHLYRRQRLVATDTARQAALAPAAFDTEVISTFTAPGPTTLVHTLTTIANTSPVLRPAFPMPLTGPRTGDDIILSNVVSLEIKPTWIHQTNSFRDPVPFNGRPAGGGSPAYPGNSDAPFDDLTKATANAGWTFDSLAPLPIRMQAMQIRVRIYDPKAKTARQASMILDQ